MMREPGREAMILEKSRQSTTWCFRSPGFQYSLQTPESVSDVKPNGFLRRPVGLDRLAHQENERVGTAGNFMTTLFNTNMMIWQDWISVKCFSNKRPSVNDRKAFVWNPDWFSNYSHAGCVLPAKTPLDEKTGHDGILWQLLKHGQHSPAKEPIMSCGHIYEKENASTATTAWSLLSKCACDLKSLPANQESLCCPAIAQA